MASLSTDPSSVSTQGPQPPSTSPLHPQHDSLPTEADKIRESHYSQAAAPQFVPQIDHEELRQDVQLAYNAILVGKSITPSPPPTRTLKTSSKHRKRAGPFIPGVLRGGRAHLLAGNTAASLRPNSLAVPHPLDVPRWSPTRADLTVKNSSASPAPEDIPGISIAHSAEQAQLSAYASSAASLDPAPGMTRSASFPRSAPVPDPHRGAALIDSRWVPMQRSTSMPVDYNSHTRRSSFYRGYSVGAHVRNSVYASHNSLRGPPLEPVPRHLSATLAHASASLYSNVPPSSAPIRSTDPSGTPQPALLHPFVRRWGGSEVPLHAIANNIDSILKQRHDRSQEVRKTNTQSLAKIRDKSAPTLAMDARPGKSGRKVVPLHNTDDIDVDEYSVDAKASSMNRSLKVSTRVNTKGHHAGKARNDIESDESENMAPTITMTRSGRHSRSVTLKDRMPSLVIAPGISHNSDSSETESATIAAYQKPRKRVKLLHRSGQERAALSQRALNHSEWQLPQANMRAPVPAIISTSSVAGSSSKNDLFPRRIFGKGRDNSRPPPRRDGEPECMKHRYQPARFAGDLYTPAIVRAGKSAGRGSAAGSAGSKEGWCGLCLPSASTDFDHTGGGDRKKAEIGGWLNLRNSSYRYHLIRQHGISPKTFMPFVEPVETLRRNPLTETRVGEGTELKGQCGTCGKWIIFGLKEATNYYVHAAKCHREVAPADEEGDEEENQATMQDTTRAQPQFDSQAQAGSSKQAATSSSSSAEAAAGRGRASTAGAQGLTSSDDSG
ncbi:hypothetical protein BCV69DRAFT_277625 [Microstroma glucosiphilum]|uniref:Transcription regulator Rua1 C-terminal domain-containing protein n=1 Tax=Pseudomicrostroma glucosiphilum TaxID=1684307 RepID=A0A316U7P6_9BASI|nr:hypothetical protein BCV69DRAFT_277625 [Pseudomicrostroma glucosiphilum]PWN20383.1 hypothetical protein BCV69DRAFT_277625 [Pseudomicrostroma glucosiphilum]